MNVLKRLVQFVIASIYWLTIADTNAQSTWIKNDLNPGGSSNPRYMTILEDPSGNPSKMLFYADDNQGNINLYSKTSYNSTPTLLRTGFHRIAPPPAISRSINGILYISNIITRSLWRTDGTVAGTYDLNVDYAERFQPSAIVPNVGLYYVNQRYELTFTNGRIGSRNTHTVNQPYNININTIGDLFYHNGKVFFSGAGEPYYYDIAADTMKLIRDINIGGSSSPSNFFRHGNEVWFFANNTNSEIQIWATDATYAGTRLMYRIPLAFRSNLANFEVLDSNTAFFSNTDPTNANKTHMLVNGRLIPFTQFGYSNNFHRLGNRVLFNCSRGIGSVSLDGSSADVFRGNYNSLSSTNPAILNGYEYFIWPDTITGKYHLHTTDGVHPPIMLSVPGFPDIESSGRVFAGTDSAIYYFNTEDTPFGEELWRFKPGSTPSTTDPHTKLYPPSGRGRSPVFQYEILTYFDGFLFFGAQYDVGGNELWGVGEPTTSAQPAIETAIYLAPVPADEFVEIKGLDPKTISSIRITSIDGRLLYIPTQRAGRFDITSLPPGIYTVLLEIKGVRQKALRFVKN